MQLFTFHVLETMLIIHFVVKMLWSFFFYTVCFYCDLNIFLALLKSSKIVYNVWYFWNRDKSGIEYLYCPFLTQWIPGFIAIDELQFFVDFIVTLMHLQMNMFSKKQDYFFLWLDQSPWSNISSKLIFTKSIRISMKPQYFHKF